MEMFKEAFEVLKRSWVRMLKLYLISFAVAMLFLFVLGIIFVVFFVATGVGAATGNGALLAGVSLPLVLLGTLVFMLFILAMAIISMAVSAGMMMVVYDENVGGREALKSGLKKVVPMLGVGVLTLIFTLGGYFVFVIPGVIFTFLLAFSNYEVVLNNKGTVEAMKRSIYIVKSNWQEVMVKVFLFIFFSIAVLGIIPSILGNGGTAGKVFSGIYSLIMNSVYSWYATCFFVTLYKSLKDKKPGVTGKGLWIMGVVGILGWVIMILMFGAMASALPGVMENIKPAPVETIDFGQTMVQ